MWPGCILVADLDKIYGTPHSKSENFLMSHINLPIKERKTEQRNLS